MATAAPLEPSGDFLAPGGPDFLRRGDALRAGKLGNDKRSMLRVELERFFLVIVEDLDVMRVPISEPVALMVCGGVLYSVGAIVYATKKPDPWPDTFGFHEIFHAFVIAGCACFAATIWIWLS
jgi:hypothetical protein